MNLRQALALQFGQPDADLPWNHAVFFWHYDAPLRVRVLGALYGWILLWLALFLRLPGIAGRVRIFADSCLFFGLLLFVVFAASAVVSSLQEQMDDRTWAERVFVSKATPEQMS